MPSQTLKAYVKESGKTIAQVENCWNKAKESADKRFKDKPKDHHYWSYVNTSTRFCLGLEQKKREEEKKKKDIQKKKDKAAKKK